MPTLTITKNYADGQAPKKSWFNDINDSLEAFFNTTKLTASNMNTSCVTTAKIQDSAITSAKLAALSCTTAKFADASVTNAKLSLGSLNLTTSSESASSTRALTSYAAMTNMSCTLTTTGRPVIVMLNLPSTSVETLTHYDTTIAARSYFLKLVRDSTDVSIMKTRLTMSGVCDDITNSHPVGAVFFIDVPSAGTYVYTLQWKVGATSTTIESAVGFKMSAYEL